MHGLTSLKFTKSVSVERQGGAVETSEALTLNLGMKLTIAT